MARPYAELREAYIYYCRYPFGTYFDEYLFAKLATVIKASKGIKSTIDEEMLFYGSNRYNKPSGDAETVAKGLKAALAPLRKKK